MTTSSADGQDHEAGPDAATVSAIAAGVLGVALTAGAFAMFGSRAGLSVGVGATLAVANLVAMSAVVRRVLSPADGGLAEAKGDPTEVRTAGATDQAVDLDTDLDARADAELAADGKAEPEDAVDHAAEGKRGGAAWGAFGLAKILFLFGGIYLLLTRRMVDPMPLVVGYGVLPIGIAASSLFTSLSPSRPRTGSKRPVRRSDPTGRRN